MARWQAALTPPASPRPGERLRPPPLAPDDVAGADVSLQAHAEAQLKTRHVARLKRQKKPQEFAC